MKTLLMIGGAVLCLLAAAFLVSSIGDQRDSNAGVVQFELPSGWLAEVHSAEPMGAKFVSCDPFQVYFIGIGPMDSAFSQENGTCQQQGTFQISAPLKDHAFKVERGQGVSVILETPGVIWMKKSLEFWPKIFACIGALALTIAAIYMGGKAYRRIRDRVGH